MLLSLFLRIKKSKEAFIVLLQGTILTFETQFLENTLKYPRLTNKDHANRDKGKGAKDI